MVEGDGDEKKLCEGKPKKGTCGWLRRGCGTQWRKAVGRGEGRRRRQVVQGKTKEGNLWVDAALNGGNLWVAATLNGGKVVGTGGGRRQREAV